MKKLFLIVLVIACLTRLQPVALAQEVSKLPRSTPELEGVSSAGIIDFINAADTSGLENHSFMMLRHGKVIAEGWWKPYRPIS